MVKETEAQSVRRKKTSGKSHSNAHNIFNAVIGSVLAVLGVITAVVTVCGYHHAQQKEAWELTLRQKTADIDRLAKEIDLLTKERDQVKKDFAACLDRESKQTASVPNPTGPPSADAQEGIATMSSPFGVGDLKITLTKLEFRDNPARYVAYATVTYRNSETRISGVEAGTTITFPAEQGYDIKVGKMNSVQARFSIKKSRQP